MARACYRTVENTVAKFVVAGCRLGRTRQFGDRTSVGGVSWTISRSGSHPSIEMAWNEESLYLGASLFLRRFGTCLRRRSLYGSRRLVRTIPETNGCQVKGCAC